jgi:hypothetical protein
MSTTLLFLRLSFKLLGADALALHERSRLLGLSVVLIRLLALAAFPPNRGRGRKFTTADD